MCAPSASNPIFLSTPSARRATAGAKPQRSVNYISIHALREEGDASSGSSSHSTSISIHALREEGDYALVGIINQIADFYPRPPRGGRRWVATWTPMPSGFLSTPSARRATRGSRFVWSAREPFLSTPSARRATADHQPPRWRIPISIHALREEGDPRKGKDQSHRSDFYPRPPRGGRPREQMPLWMPARISIHALREEGDTFTGLDGKYQGIFLSTPSARRATPGHGNKSGAVRDFYPRPPRGGRRSSM